MNRNLSVYAHFMKLIYYFGVIYYLGLFKGLILLILLSIVVDWLLKVLFKLEKIEHPDSTFAFAEEKDSFILMGCGKLDKMNVDQFKQMFIEKGLKRFAKLRSIKKYIFGLLFWREEPISEAIKQINVITDVSINNESDIHSYMDSKLKFPFKFDKHQWALDLFRNEDGSGRDHGAG